MDAHLFRILSGLLDKTLTGARVERIHEPLPGVFSFTLFAAGEKQRLLFRPGKSGSLLFLTASPALANPPFPSARVMRLRKYAEGRRLGPLHADWARRRAVFPLPGPLPGSHAGMPGQETGQELWLLLDMKTGPDILFALPDDFDAPVSWPTRSSDRAALSSLLAGAEESGPLAPWRAYPPLTPALRRTLLALNKSDPAEILPLLRDLEAGEDDLFCAGLICSGQTCSGQICSRPVGSGQGGTCRLSAWPLPGEVSEPVPPDPQARLELFRAAQEPLLLDAVGTDAARQSLQEQKKARKKQASLHAKLLAEKERLLTVLARREDARLIQANLWRFDANARFATVDVDNTDRTGTVSIALNPRLSLKDNMAALFHQSDRAKRGLGYLAARLTALESGDPQPAGPAPAVSRDPKKQRPAVSSVPVKTTWTEFISSDGFLLRRGKSAQGNRDILRAAGPHDLWFHAEDGPSAHLVLRRHHAGHTAPETTLREAAALVALKSAGKNDAAVRVMCALVKEVKPVKGGRPGAVTVRAALPSITATPDPDLEERLSRAPTIIAPLQE